jgi:MFS family permease
MNRLATLAGYSGFVLLGWNAVLVPALIRSIQPDFRQADAAFGLFFLLSALLYAAGSLGGGFLTERVGRRAVLALATLLLGVGLGAAAVVGSVVYPPLIGLMATPMGLRAGLVGAGLLGVPTALAIMTACAIARRSAAVPEDPALEAAS